MSSFSLFVGRIVEVDWSDGAGMNLLNITNKQWVPQILDFIGDNLENKVYMHGFKQWVQMSSFIFKIITLLTKVI